MLAAPLRFLLRLLSRHAAVGGLAVLAIGLLTLPGCKANKGAASPHSSPPMAAKRASHVGTSPDYDYGGGYTYSGDDAGSYDRSYESEPAPAADGAYEADSVGTSASGSPRRERRVRRRDRPGLGTSYGESHFSRVVTAPFVRGGSQPDVVLSMHYNDWSGVSEAGWAYGQRGATRSVVATHDSVFTVSIIDEHGSSLDAVDIDGRRYAVGDVGGRYKIRITNESAFRFEVVASVDGLDVIDGSPAAFQKRGYVIAPWSSITIDGWRTSEDAVAAFRFSDIGDSYAERTGNGRNVGVVGVAFFHEQGGLPWSELDRRHRAEPFPGRFAEPPPPRW